LGTKQLNSLHKVLYVHPAGNVRGSNVGCVAVNRTEVSLDFPPSVMGSSGIISGRFSQLLSQLTGRYLTSETECCCKVLNTRYEHQ